MDFGQFDQRAKAEAGVMVQLHQPYDKTAKIEDENGPCGFMVRGVAAKSVQERLAALQKKAGKAKDGEDEQAVLERIHESQIEAAMGYIIEAVNISIAGKPVATAEGIRAVLGMTFPDLRLVQDENGKQIYQSVKNDDGEWVGVPKFEVANDTFAMQVIKAAEDGARFFGKTSAA
ncbi:hypothetical protein [Sagittula sp. S175]|uniref:hypothetical protein n=1 Tax=Sagittula sp. S175 TaxID=3415129 RepID=UPI003C7B093A